MGRLAARSASFKPGPPPSPARALQPAPWVRLAGPQKLRTVEQPAGQASRWRTAGRGNQWSEGTASSTSGSQGATCSCMASGDGRTKPGGIRPYCRVHKLHDSCTGYVSGRYLMRNHHVVGAFCPLLSASRRPDRRPPSRAETWVTRHPVARSPSPAFTTRGYKEGWVGGTVTLSRCRVVALSLQAVSPLAVFFRSFVLSSFPFFWEGGGRGGPYPPSSPLLFLSPSSLLDCAGSRLLHSIKPVVRQHAQNQLAAIHDALVRIAHVILCSCPPSPPPPPERIWTTGACGW